MTAGGSTGRKSGKGACICEPCPSYNECMRAAGTDAFCKNGASPDGTFDPRVCLCIRCPAAPGDRHGAGWFCIAGKAGRLRQP